MSTGKGPAISGAGAHLGGSVLASAPVVLGSSGASGGGSFLPATLEGSAQIAPLPSLSPEPPRASADCLAYIQRSARHSGFSAAVVRQLTLCRRRSTRVNYQAKWAVYRSWCRRHGHSISRPTVSKVADLLLYLHRSLSLSYSSIASYHSMLSGVFRFILPELSSRFVLHVLLCSFRLERPLPSPRVPPWDLLLVLHFLRGPPFEPLSSCFLRDLTQKVLFLVSLATARRVGELQAVSRDISFSGSDIYLSYLQEFRAKTESSVNPLPRSFCVRSLAEFVGDLPEELLPVLSVPFVSITLVSLLSLLVLAPCLFLLVLLLVLFPRMLVVSFFAISYLAPMPLLRLLLLGLLLLLLPRFGLIAYVGSRLLGLFRVTLLSPCCCYLVFFVGFYILLPDRCTVFLFSRVWFGASGGCWICGVGIFNGLGPFVLASRYWLWLGSLLFQLGVGAPWRGGGGVAHSSSLLHIVWVLR